MTPSASRGESKDAQGGEQNPSQAGGHQQAPDERALVPSALAIPGAAANPESSEGRERALPGR